MSAQRISQELPPPPFIPEGSVVVDAVFNVTRARLVFPDGPVAEAFSAGKLRWTPAIQGNAPRNVLRMGLSPHGEWPGVPRLIESEGEMLEFVKYVFRGEDGRALSPVFAPGSKLRAHDLPDSDDAIGHSFTAFEYLDHLDKMIKGIRDKWRKRLYRFFYTFDLHTNPVIWEYLGYENKAPSDCPDWDETLVPRPNVVSAAIERTKSRLTARAGARVRGTPLPPKFEHGSPEMADVRLLADLQESLYLQQGLSADEVEEAFELFANGELRQQLDLLAWVAQPSSGYYFFFGEFALMALDNDMGEATWMELTRALVRTQKIFVMNYAPPKKPGAKRAFKDYHSGNFVRPRADDEYKSALREEYAGLDQPALKGKASKNTHDNLGAI